MENCFTPPFPLEICGFLDPADPPSIVHPVFGYGSNVFMQHCSTDGLVSAFDYCGETEEARFVRLDIKGIHHVSIKDPYVLGFRTVFDKIVVATADECKKSVALWLNTNPANLSPLVKLDLLEFVEAGEDELSACLIQCLALLKQRGVNSAEAWVSRQRWRLGLREPPSIPVFMNFGITRPYPQRQKTFVRHSISQRRRSRQPKTGLGIIPIPQNMSFVPERQARADSNLFSQYEQTLLDPPQLAQFLERNHLHHHRSPSFLPSADKTIIEKSSSPVVDAEDYASFSHNLEVTLKETSTLQRDIDEISMPITRESNLEGLSRPILSRRTIATARKNTRPEKPLKWLFGRDRKLMLEEASLRVLNRKFPILVHGLPGIGKSTFLAALAEKSEIQIAYKSNVLWINARRAGILTASAIADVIARALNLSDMLDERLSGLKLRKLQATLINELPEHMVIFDNADLVSMKGNYTNSVNMLRQIL